MYQKHPKSRIFAPLAHIYRRMGLWDKAFRLCQEGLKNHPDFASGHVLLALLYLDRHQWEKAIRALRTATRLSPENLLARQTLARTWLKLKNPTEALQAFKMVLFLAPDNEEGQRMVGKLEPLCARHYEDKGFAFKNIQEVARFLPEEEAAGEEALPPLHPLSRVFSRRTLQKFETRLSVVQALIYRGHKQKAARFLEDMEKLYAGKKDPLQSIQKLKKRFFPQAPSSPPPARPVLSEQMRHKKIQTLHRVLKRLEQKLSTVPSHHSTG